MPPGCVREWVLVGTRRPVGWSEFLSPSHGAFPNGNDQALDLPGTVVDLGDLGVAKEFPYRAIAHEAVAAEGLDRRWAQKLTVSLANSLAILTSLLYD
jgi:hypothetical protein